MLLGALRDHHHNLIYSFLPYSLVRSLARSQYRGHVGNLKPWVLIDNTRKLSAARIHSRFESTRDPRGHGVTLRAFLSPLRHMEQLLLVTSCDSPAGIGASLWTHNGWTDRRDVGNSILDIKLKLKMDYKNLLLILLHLKYYF